MRAVETFTRDTSILRRALNAQTMRLQAISHNVANANTPGFKRTVVQFEAALRQELYGESAAGTLPLRTTHPRHFKAFGHGASTGAQPRFVRDHSTAMRNDGNNVDPDREMVDLARAQLSFQALSRVVADRYRRLRHTVQQGGR